MQSKVVDPEVVLWVFFYVFKVELKKVLLKKMSDFSDDEIMDMARSLYGRGMQGRLGSTNSAEEEEKYLRALMAVERLFPGQL